MGRTVEELLYGSDTYRPISSAELTEWMGLYRVKAFEQEEMSRR